MTTDKNRTAPADKTRAFLRIARELPPKRPVSERVLDWREIEKDLPTEKLRAQASRCMDCGIPFCHKGCPLGNLIPDWNDRAYRDRFDEAIDRLHATNNFPEFTGRVCPAPCEESCVLNIHGTPVTIKQIEKQIADRAFHDEFVTPVLAGKTTGKRVAVVGSGPAGLAAAQQLARAGHAVTVFERSDRIGGMLRYGIPDFKMEKWLIDRRVAQMRAEGVEFKTSVNVGSIDYPAATLRSEFDAVCLAIGALSARELPIPGRELQGIYPAMEFLTQQNKVVAGDVIPNQISAKGRSVLILGGGDTGADCLGTSHRQGAKRVFQYDLRPAPPEARTADMPWPNWPMIMRSSTSHEEGGTRDWAILAKKFTADAAGRVNKMHGVRVEWDTAGMRELAGTEFEIEVDLVLLAMGFIGPERNGVIEAMGLELNERGAVRVGANFETSQKNVYACGDASRGASLVVWAIAEGREAARAIDENLSR